MKLANRGFLLAESLSRRLCFRHLLSAAVFLCILFFIMTSFITYDYKESTISSPREVSAREPPKSIRTPESKLKETTMSIQITHSNSCKTRCNPSGSEPLPKGIVRRTSDLEMRPLWGSPHSPKRKGNKKASKSLLAITVGINQKQLVDQIVKKFFSSDFVLMVFHYDGVVNEWRDLFWSDVALHVSAINQTKWWFAKRFLHPDVVSEYDYIFLWDEDLGVEHFNPKRYLSIIRREGLDISQPGLDSSRSLVHHQITTRQGKGDVHRRTYLSRGRRRCNENSTAPPCTGWVEMMAPVFSRDAWRCAWHMIQNDLIHAWGLDMKLGYCAQDDRSKTIGVVDSEYIIHKGLPTLGGLADSRGPSGSSTDRERLAVRRRSYTEQDIFKRRWQKAATEDKCWTDPYPD
ncbi:uncharacterized protein M6B38_380035 [Iris pallida]|uniref:Uncharacterized protein n=1 Tax=Iris pallida TaxID=29817 RepID=A0AAX6G8A5_IRIPA|nr:uncharacterized protein M6B38_380035 [Iris pallida]